MALPHIILSMLCETEAAGYDITKKFSGLDGTYWQASHQQVYREMGKMEKQGLMSHHLVPQSGKPDRKVYTITKEGLIRLKEWIDTDTSLPILRDEITSKITAADISDIPNVISDLDNIIDTSGKKLDAIHGFDTKTDLTRCSPFEKAKHKICINRTRGHWKEILDWAESSKHQLTQFV
ncbi:PadR family transcriptional regulator [Vibrio sp. D404a]|uniref:PadR family transcriptional regulator n=1 Tax=unclassified Vibrio TaxID=2614977 RepID=UPI0025579DCF|nr:MULTISPECIES: PadR family transcriptional regulator [unclassified Vibrio]MDK9739281.1 PadR family transcriptional regulator [Vibrio sp. D404a]MDK9797683.1 PadR family transcriptional regulator [Vibrio sp. D449a]